MKSPKRYWFISLFCLTLVAVTIIVLAYFFKSPVTYTPDTTYSLIQDTPEVTVLPDRLQRLSWGAVIAGSLIALFVMFLLDLMGAALGISRINPERQRESASASQLATGTLVWITVSNLIALFLGGWVAAYLAGIPEQFDGSLHGILVWALTGLITMFFVMSGIGRIMNGIASLMSTALNLTGTVASGTSHVAGNALQATGQIAGGAAHSVGNLSTHALSLLASGIQNSAQTIGAGVSNLTDTAIENTPDVQNALDFQNLSFDQIKLEAKQLLRQAGKDPNQIQAAVDETVQDAKAAVNYLVKNPENADQLLDVALRRVLRRGESIANEVDRDALLNLIVENSDMSREEATQQIEKWEQQFQTVKAQTQKAREIAKEKAQEFRNQAEQKAQELYDKAQAQVEKMQHEAEERLRAVAHEADERAREAGQVAADTFAKAATGITVAMLIGLIAAGFGGYFGTPEELPDVPIEEVKHNSDSHVILLFETEYLQVVSY